MFCGNDPLREALLGRTSNARGRPNARRDRSLPLRTSTGTVVHPEWLANLFNDHEFPQHTL
jgi:hypothetical protein